MYCDTLCVPECTVEHIIIASLDSLYVCHHVSEPESVSLKVDGSTDKCSLGEDINFKFTGFTVSGKVLYL